MDPKNAMHAAALWGGVHIILLLVLSVLVTRQRRKHKVLIGDGGITDLSLAIRAFGNAAEYIPAAIGGLAMLGLVAAYPVLIHLIGLTLFVGRLLHAVAISRSGEASSLRAVGVLATWIAYIAMGAALVFYAIP